MPEEPNALCPQCHKPWHERPGSGCRLFAHATASHNPRRPEETLEAPRVGWGIFDPDAELKQETMTLIEALRDLPIGQRQALLTRAVPRYLAFIEDVDMNEGQQPSAEVMVHATGNLSAFWMDILGIP